MNKQKLMFLLMSVVCITFGWLLKGWLHTCPVAEPKVVTKIEYKDRTQTQIEYVPKIVYADGSKEKTDVDVQLDKQQLNVKVNDKEIAIQKQDDEKYIFDKNKLQLTQSSTAELSITVPVIDKTKRWEIGIGASKNGVVGMVGFPIKENISGWVAGRKDDMMVGVMVKI